MPESTPSTSPPDAAPLALNPGGSFLRDRLANERTLLAWVRTAITFVALGLGLAKLSVFLRLTIAEHQPSDALLATLPDPATSRLVAMGLVGLGAVVAGLGTWRSRIYGRIIDPEDRAPRRSAIEALGWGTALLSALVLLYVGMD